MHEYSIVSALIDRVEDVARKHDGARVKKVHVKIGELAGVEVGLLATAFEMFRQKTCCDGAELDVVAAPAVWRCPRCGADLPRGARLTCALCDVPARLSQGDEILLERIELEVPDV